MRTTTAIIVGSVAATWWLVGLASAQQTPRMQFSTPIAPNGAPTAATAPLAAPPAGVGGVPGAMPAAAPAPFGSAAPAPFTPAAPAMTPAPAGAPLMSSAPPATPFSAPSPPVAFQGGVQSAGGWDPYSAAGIKPAPLLPQDPYLNVAPGGPGSNPSFTRFMQNIELRNEWLANMGGEGFGMNTLGLTATFAFPFQNAQTPLLVTPGFGWHLLDGPVAVPGGPVLPPQLYDAYLDVQWNPRITPWLAAELGVQVGVYSDFQSFITQSLRFPSHGLGVIYLSDSFQIKAGVFYLDRNHIKILPAGGVVWTPNADWHLDILFPNPKVAWRMKTVGAAEWWMYVRGEYGGGAWTVQQTFFDGSQQTQRVDYNDIRVALGVEAQHTAGRHGFFEIGVSFNREILFVEAPENTVHPDTTLYLGGGLAF